MSPLQAINLLIQTHEQTAYYLPGDVWQKQYARMREVKAHLEKVSEDRVDTSKSSASSSLTSASR